MIIMRFETNSFDSMVDFYRKQAKLASNDALNRVWLWTHNDLQLHTPVYSTEAGGPAMYPTGNHGGTLLNSFTQSRTVGAYVESSIYTMSGESNPAAADDYALYQESVDMSHTKEGATSHFLRNALWRAFTGDEGGHEPLMLFIANDLYLKDIH